jgi:hypothetical protein
MLFISHRGNINGADPTKENSPQYIEEALQKNFEVEVDVRFLNNSFYLGHDNPNYKVSNSFIRQKKLWLHAKNIEALYELQKMNVNYFWHENDAVTLTSNGFIWTYPGKQLTLNSICVLPEKANIKKFNCAGICSDYILKYFNEQN